MSGKLTYFHTRLPGPEAPDDTTLATGFLSLDLLKFGRYFTVTVDSLGNLKGMAYLGRDPLDARTFAPLLGLQETFLKTAMERHERDQLEDWVEYLQQSWAGALYHDSFAEFASGLQRLLQEDRGVREIVESLLELIDEGKDNEIVLRTRKKRVAEIPEHTRKLVEGETLAFLRRHAASLSQYRPTEN